MKSANSSYDAAKAAQREAALGIEVLGVPLDVEDSRKLIAGRKFLPISGCYCVQDSPENPCPCGDLIFWLPFDSIIGDRESKHKSDQGQPIHSFLVASDAQVLVEERPRSYAASDLPFLVATQGEVDELVAEDDGMPGIALKPNRIVVSIIAKAVVAVLKFIAEHPNKKDLFSGSGYTKRPPL